MTALARLDLVGVVIIGIGLRANKQPRARTECLGRLLWELERRGVTHVILETRDRAGNDADRATLTQLRNAGTVTSAVRLEWGDPWTEPLLWLPDVVAGAAVLHACGHSEHYLKQLGEGLIITRFQLD